MKANEIIVSFFLPFLMMALPSCEGRSGYLDEGQQNTVALLTDVEWLVVYADYGLGNEQTFEDVTTV